MAGRQPAISDFRIARDAGRLQHVPNENPTESAKHDDDRDRDRDTGHRFALEPESVNAREFFEAIDQRVHRESPTFGSARPLPATGTFDVSSSPQIIAQPDRLRQTGYSSSPAASDAAFDVGRLRIAGKRITSRRLGWSVSGITSRSMPMPTPPVGGMPYINALM